MRMPSIAWSLALFALVTAPALATPQAGSTPKLTSQTGGSVSGQRVPVPVAVKPQQNVLLILCDQFNARMLGHEDNGYGGVTGSLTPNLDRIAAEGVRFSSAACSSAVCQASRYSILTGRWAHNHGVRVNKTWEPRGETTFPELALAAGYRTVNIGKHHMVWPSQPLPWRDEHGFENIIDTSNYTGFCIANGVPTYKTAGNKWNMPGLPAQGGFEDTGFTFNTNQFHPAGYWADEVIRFLGERAGPGGDGKPWVCWYSMLGPHTPVLPSGVAPDDWAHKYHPYTALDLPPNLNKLATTARLAFSQSNFTAVTDDQWREVLSYYYGVISQIDWNIGRVLDELDALGLADDTLVIFTADHGEMASEMRCWTKGAGNYDALTRVPLLMRLPGVLPAGKLVTAPVNNIDLFPTLVEATGVPISEPVRTAVDGVSLFELMIQSTPPAGWRQETFHELGTTLKPALRHFMVRTPTAKYGFDELDGSEEFYDLAADPFEITDRFNDSDPGIQAQIADLKARFALWWNNALGHAPEYTPTSSDPASLPAPARDPQPSDGESSVARDIDPSWVPSTSATGELVYFGTDALNPPLLATLGHMQASFNPGSLAPATTYWWRVDEVNANGTVAGPLWSFTTEVGGTGGPGLAATPTPLPGSTGAPLATTLLWTAGSGALSQDVYFGTAGDLQLVQAALPGGLGSWSLGALAASVSYEWRVDSVDGNGTTEGDVWSFETAAAGLARRARPVFPRHFQKSVSNGGVLSWKPGAKALSHDVYFGSAFPLTLQGNQTQTWWSPGPLTAGQVYYWRIDEVNASGTTRGWTARFRR